MSLSYSLSVENLNNSQFLSEVLANYGIRETPDPTFIEGRFFGSSGERDIFPTGEYIIRKGMYINGMYVYVGSYKAYCVDLFGSGNHGYAWDGFIMVMRANNLNGIYPIFEKTSFGYVAGIGFGFLPMRMMFEVNPGPIGDASDIADDSEVGLYGLDVYKSYDDFRVNGEDKDIKIITCGYQRINPSAESVPTGMDYVGNLYMGRLLRFNQISGGLANYQYFGSAGSGEDDFIQVTWRANDANHIDKTFASSRFSHAYNLEDWVGVIEDVSIGGGPLWEYSRWLSGNTPDTNKLAQNVGVFPRKFTDITCVSQQPFSLTELADSVFMITGDCSLDTDNDGVIEKTVPSLMACGFPYYTLISGAILQPPFMNLNPSGATSLSVRTNYTWELEDLTPSYNLDGSVAVFCSQPYEAIVLSPPYDVESYPTTLFALNDVTYDGNTYGAIYAIGTGFLAESFPVFPMMIQGGSFQTASGFDLPSKWYGKAVQQRTFTIAEEDIAKQGTLNLETGEFTPTSNSLFDNDSQEYIGYISNYQRYGAFNLGDPSVEPTAVGGQLTGSGYGFLGIKNGTGPIAIMFDSGSPFYDGDTNTWSVVARAEGDNLNSNNLTNPTSTTRKIINCGWDNDRDQWLFVCSDNNDFSIISASSDFSTGSNNIGFLDQTSNFKGIKSGTDGALYTPITMSNALDGWVFFGELDTDSIYGIKPAVLGSATSITKQISPTESITYDVYLDATTQIKRITGTSGRTARVWVDYILFDGPDAIIANKLKERGMKVSIEAVEWFKRTIIQTGDLNITAEEIEMWMRDQQDEYKQTLKEIERQGRLRRRKKQVSAYTEGIEEQIDPDFMDTEVKDFMGTFTPDTRPPTPEEARIEKKKKGGYTPQQGSYYDEVFED